MVNFYPLTVTQKRKTIRDAVVLTLQPPADAAGKFNFIQGQYLTFRQNFDGKELRRSYSICAGKDEGILQVGIKRVDDGAFSRWANDSLKVGDVIEAMAPAGRFFIDLEPGRARNYIGFAGGSGITPVLSILKTTLTTEPKSNFTLIYANRAMNSTMFREELEDLKNLYMGRFNVIHILKSDTQEIDLFTGRLSEEKCSELLNVWINLRPIDFAFICGPRLMMEGIKSALIKFNIDEKQIKYELFAANQPGRLERSVAGGSPKKKSAQTLARITLDGTTQSVVMRRDMPILAAALENDMDVPYACRAGVCASCRCRLVEGEIEMIANHALEDDEIEKGYILSCQSYPLTDKILVDYDQ